MIGEAASGLALEVSEMLNGTGIKIEFAVNSVTRYRRYRPLFLEIENASPLPATDHADQVLSGVGVSPVLTSTTKLAPGGRAPVQETAFQVAA